MVSIVSRRRFAGPDSPLTACLWSALSQLGGWSSFNSLADVRRVSLRAASQGYRGQDEDGAERLLSRIEGAKVLSWIVEIPVREAKSCHTADMLDFRHCRPMRAAHYTDARGERVDVVARRTEIIDVFGVLAVCILRCLFLYP